MEALQESICQLLSVANREYIFPTSLIKKDSKGDVISTDFYEPIFLTQGFNCKLIEDHNLKKFLKDGILKLDDEFTRWQLGSVIDHYLQALTLRSAWPSTLGIFTAMEILKSAYQSQIKENTKRSQNVDSFHWVPEVEFHKPQVLNALVDTLEEHFGRFKTLDQNERKELDRSLSKINIRSSPYKAQIQSMLQYIGVKYTDSEVDAFVNIRNDVIHTGEAKERYNRDYHYFVQASELFERTLLTILGYSGNYNPMAKSMEFLA